MDNDQKKSTPMWAWAVVVVLIIVVAFLVVRPGNNEPTDDTLEEEGSELLTGEDLTEVEIDLASSESNEPAPVVVPDGATVVTYTNNGFLPASIGAAPGTTVYFRNNSNHGMWITAGEVCSDGTFNSCTAIPVGGVWSYTFAEAGEFEYSNNVKPEEIGRVVIGG